MGKRSIIRALVSGFLLAAVVPMLVVTLLVLMVNHANTRAAVEKQNMQVARTVAVAVTNFLHEPVVVLEGVKNLARSRGYAGGEFSAIVNTVIMPDHYFRSVMMLNRQGKVVAFWGARDLGLNRSELLGVDLSATDFVRQALEEGRLVWSNTFISPTTGEPSINLCLPWENGLVVGEIPLAGLSRIVDQTRMSSTSYAYLVDRQGRIIAHPDISLVREQASASSLTAVRQGLQGKFGTYTYDTRGGKEIGSVLGIAETGWLVVVGQNEKEVFSFLRKTELLMLAGLVVAFAVALGLSLLVVTRITRPLGQLQTHSQLLAAGDYDIAPIPAEYQEISLLNDSFHAMAHAVRQREHELKDRNEELAMVEEELRQQLDEYLKSQDELLSEKNKLETILACMGDGLSIQDREYRVILQNEHHRQMVGEAQGKFCYEVYEKSDRICDNCPVARAYEDGQVHTLERCVVQEDGDHYFEITASPLRDGTGTIVAGIELVREITGRRRTEEEVRRLNDELEQRVLERTRELSDANQSLQEEIRQRSAAQEEISWLNEDLERRSHALEETNRELEAFSYSVSHDLRAPLRHIEGFSRLLMEESADRLDPHSQDYLNRVCRASQRMSVLIDDLLNLSRVTRGDMHRQQVNLSRLAAEIAADLQEGSPDRSVTFEIAEGMTAWGDPHLLRVLLVNLLGNSWKYTGKCEETVIEFGCREIDREKVWFVKDNGVGFNMAYADRLFGTFQRLHHSSDFEGTGIGLATVKRIINRHEGKVWGEGEVGVGATFYFTLPSQPPKESPFSFTLPA